ncbi:ABC transporter permease [bacterium]|jgi:putative ABC transport system permease protein|nr:ABC transporter permease [bacterium]MBT4122211.1 ABC transporter permease [bacterium]MBT4495881.1 ABC transporter permease [bacterium]MBT4763941.1 ABC transporter permease [bacterium]MBT5401312.1 ABC transporter permease [bacterium]
MKIADIIYLSVRSFKTKRLRTALTILGVGVGISAVLFLVSLGYGLQNLILTQITSEDSLLSLDVSAGSSGLISLDQTSLDKFASVENVNEVSAMSNLSGQLTLDEITGDAVVYVIDESFLRLSGVKPQYGESFSDSNEPEIIISSIGAQLFDFEDPGDIIGKEIEITLFISTITEEEVEEVEVITLEQKFKVTGVISDENSNYFFLPKTLIGDVVIEEFDQIKVKVSDGDYLEEVRNEIIEAGFLVTSLTDTIDQAKKIFKIIQIILGLFGLVALAVSAIGMFNTMTITLLERTNEIGIMRAIGVTKKDIIMLFLFESMVIGFLGGLSGIILGILSGEIFNLVLNVFAKNLGSQALDLFYYPFWFILFIIIFSTIIGFLTGIYPSKRAGNLNPLDALRYK